MAPASLVSLVDGEKSQQMKKHFYIPDQDEYNSSSGPLNGLVLSSILNAMPSCRSSPSRKALKHGYVADLIREGGVSPCSLLLGLIYIQRLTRTNQEYLSTVSSRDLFLVAMVVASKYMNDEGEMEALTNSEWSAVGCIRKSTLDQLERDFLNAIDWRLYVPLQEFYAFVGSAEGRVAMEQACRRGWMTYTDLTAIWENSDLQANMMKHTIKVAFSGVGLYLVCVSTLMAAIHPWALPNHTHSDTPTYVSSSHQLQQDALQATLNMSTQQYDATSQLMLASTDLPVSLQEAWPGDGVCLWDPTLLTSPVSDSGGTGSGIGSHSSLLHHLLGADHTPNHTHHIDTGRELIQDTTLLQDTLFQDSSGLQVIHMDKWNTIMEHLALLDRNNRSHSQPSNHPPPSPSVPPSHPPLPPVPPSHPPPAIPSHPPPAVPPPPLPSRCNASTRVLPQFVARVESLQAEDLGYHYKGTFHWDPLINSSSSPQDQGSSGGFWKP